jgi:hypothetical protein
MGQKLGEFRTRGTMKQLFRSLAIASVITGSVTFAGTFSDVPSSHWAYSAIEKVSSAGIIKGYHENFKGSEKASRYEMAVIVARLLDAISKGGAQLDDDTAKSLTRLVEEFSNELALLGAKVGSLEARTVSNENRIEDLEGRSFGGSGSVQWGGSMGIRWQASFADGLSDRITSDPQLRLELNAAGRANNKTRWGISLRTGQSNWPSQSWGTFGTDSSGTESFLGGSELRLSRYFLDYRATDDLSMSLGKQENPFMNTELIFDEDVNPTGASESYQVDEHWTVRAGQYFLKSGTDYVSATGANDRPKEDVYLFAHQVEYKRSYNPGETWTARWSNLNFTGEQFIHPGAGLIPAAYTQGAGLMNGHFNRVSSWNGTDFQNNEARSGNYYNVAADGVNNPAGAPAHNLNSTTNSKQLRLLSDFNLFNTYFGYEDNSDPTDPWGFKVDYVINNGAWNGEDSAWWFEIYRGSLKKKGDVRYGYQYKRVESDAVLAFLNQDELSTNVKGSSVFLETRVKRNMDWFATYFLFEPVTTVAIDKEGELRTGLSLTF